MSAGHGSSPAAWSAVSIALVGTTVAGIGTIPSFNGIVFTIGCVIIAAGGIVGKVMSAAGLGADTPGHR